MRVGGDAVIALAVGFRRGDSVVGRSPLGMAAICVFAVLPLLTTAVNAALLGTDDAVYDLESMRAAESWRVGVPGEHRPHSGVGGPLAAAVAGARTVPSPWNWTPFGSLALFVLLGGSIFFNMALVAVWWLNNIAPLTLLGVVILRLGPRRPVLHIGEVGTGRPREHG